MITGIRFPLDLSAVGFPEVVDLGGISLWSGPPAWAWSRAAPALPVDVVGARAGEPEAGWGIDHAVVTTPSLDDTVVRLESAGADLRRRAVVRGRPAAFLVAALLIEVVEVADRPTRLWGIALETDEPLAEVCSRWRSYGWPAGEPHAAVQPGRQIFSVSGTTLAVMSRR